MNHSRSLFAAAVLLCATAISCKKNENPVTTPAQTETQTLLMNATNDIVSLSNQENTDVTDIVGGDSSGTGGDSSSCRTITFNPSRKVYPHQKIIDYGSGCTGADGITRTGKKMITIYANPDSAAAGTLISETTFSNFSVDGINVTGDVKTYVDTAAVPGPRVLKVVAEKGLSDSKGNSKTISATSYWKQIAGAGTATHTDDVYQITSTASGNETLNGATAIQWTSNTDPVNPVIKPGDCYHRTQGGVQVQLHIITGGSADFTEYLDYGDGTCDDTATLSINGGTPQTVTLPLRFWPLNL